MNKSSLRIGELGSSRYFSATLSRREKASGFPRAILQRPCTASPVLSWGVTASTLMKFAKFCSMKAVSTASGSDRKSRASQKCRATNAALSSVVVIPEGTEGRGSSVMESTDTVSRRSCFRLLSQEHIMENNIRETNIFRRRHLIISFIQFGIFSLLKVANTANK